MLILILASLPSCASPDASLPAAKLSNGLNGTAQAEPPQHDLQRQQQYPSTLQAVYVAPEHPFAEVEAFVTTSSQEYHLSIKCYTLDMQEAMGRYLAHTPGIQAVFVGTRRADPHGEKLTHFDRTDHGWPDFMRVHPVIDWHYTEIWAVSTHPSSCRRQPGAEGLSSLFL
jgi:FAD synthetase